jgi:hypothetical protein
MATLLTGFLGVSKILAQPVAEPVENRFLLVFDTSSDMKKRLPATEVALDTMLASSMRGQLHAGDMIAAWTFDRELHPEHLVLPWVPANAADIASNIVRFVSRQHYSKKTSFDALSPSLNRVVQNSDRLTVLIFCDGAGQFAGTPFDAGVKRIFEQQQARQKKVRQPFIVVLRSQLGNYVGCTVGLPPALANFPPFPPMPSPPAEPTKAPPPPRPSVEVPPLIVIGTKAGTNLPPEPKLAPPLPANPLPPAGPVRLTNLIANVETNLPPSAVSSEPTSAPVAAPANFVAPKAAVQTNAFVPPPEKSGLSGKKALAIGAAFLVLAGALTLLISSRSRKAEHGSLITHSMNKEGKPPVRT